jgi:hypothetical protein
MRRGSGEKGTVTVALPAGLFGATRGHPLNYIVNYSIILRIRTELLTNRNSLASVVTQADFIDHVLN